MAWQAEQRERCPGCGRPVDETTVDDNEQAYDVTVMRCHACAAKDAALAPYRKAGTAAGLLASTELLRR